MSRTSHACSAANSYEPQEENRARGHGVSPAGALRPRCPQVRGPVEDLLPADPRGLVQSEDVVVRGLGRDGVGSREDVPAGAAAADRSSHALDEAFHHAPHLAGPGEREQALRVDPAHETQLLPELALQLQRVHARAPGLHGVQDVEADLDEVRDDGAQRAAAVVGHPEPVPFPDGEELGHERLDHVPPGFGAHHHRLLPRHVVAAPQPVQRHLGAGSAGQLEREAGAAREHRAGERRVCGEVCHRVFEPAQAPVHLEGAGRDVAAQEEPVAHGRARVPSGRGGNRSGLRGTGRRARPPAARRPGGSRRAG